MQTVILCGGKGTRAYPHTEVVPKPLLEVDGTPILGHLLGIYAAQGFTDFILSAGYLADRVEEFARTLPKTWQVEVVDTGEESNTADRITGVRHLLDDVFMANYSDGLGNVDIETLVAFHKGHPGAATLTTVPLPSQYGTIESDRYDRVVEFREKPKLPDHRINGGYFVMDRRVLDLFDGPDLERDVLPTVGAAGELYSFRHQGFWKSMDTYKDAQELTALAHDGAPWNDTPGAPH
ncbi:sugar phosphate nucleotidyltransferase [Actinospongicola halichondriae]|uniref:sugar phosphate nucleotidyltransferase n=1 Tax=Actinospongicola halichondriae TaxID=3236844 RepID=UPI003D4AEC59